ncbi:TadE/TadG family type IV pilus assembly protein [Acidocella aminolytica]|uniref:Putative Flp pilus-assembly TadG-like N-terminal domain-containing protein n=1 Tax=Acidocella aminolytica 101 = DSM 11237 TaxID=1120923 RepID=A0A0D6PHX8_9PROT|nr:TadE/TadG family type IV pilus assembly protein [Acidocella aminolytica]GAN80808.1 hypothetical protein Aam_060_034 [Acidocella aminolytica 101 = DSM 11237]GBQ36383.1 hypothetical protein AA11237_1228 [Acidocella aminolytica 101 = DSM 11237]SHE32946.1 Flp pilus assembly protein TadG [Acidocella aminolytica 101 = DSM 11237]
MLTRLFRRLFSDRKGATAVTVAIMLVPMMIAGVSAIDMARIAAARTVLQSAVDSAAISGGGAYSTSGSSTAAVSAAQATYAGSTATLGAMTMRLTPGTDNSLVSVYCQANGNSTCGSVGADTTGACPSAYHYCVVVNAQLELSNLLLRWIVPQTFLTVKAVDTVGTSTYTVNAGSFTSNGIGGAMDLSNILAYVVPTSSTGANEFSTVPAANSACTTGVISYETSKTSVPAGTGCNFALIGSSTGGSESGTLTFSAGQYISFAFANLTGGTYSFGGDGGVLYYDNITVNGTTYSNGACATVSYQYYYYWGEEYRKKIYSISNLSKATCQEKNGTSLYAECPAHNLYGSITQGTGGSLTYNGATADDSLNIYSSSYEMLGYPPTYDTNHVLPTFTATTSEYIGYGSYSVSTQCPRWPTTAAAALTDGDSSQVPYDTNINAYATYYPGKTVTDSRGTSIYPPALQSACSPAASYPSSGNQVYSNAWWGWSAPNPQSTTTIYYQNSYPASSSFCSNQPTTSAGSYDPAYNNCALVIQPLGNAVPTLTSGEVMQPDYYLVVRATNNATAPIVLLDPIYDNQNGTSSGTSFADIYPGVATQHLGGYDSNISVNYTYNKDGSLASAAVTDKDSSGYYPTYDASTGYPFYRITKGQYAGDYVFIERPSQSDSGTQSYDKDLPPETSLRCYNPQQNGYSSSTFSVSNNNNGSPIDPLANPELGAIDCSLNPNGSFALYWNDMGGAQSDNIIYRNAAFVFTCPTPTYTSGAAAPSTLSG